MVEIKNTRNQVANRLRRAMTRAMAVNPEVLDIYEPDGVAPTVTVDTTNDGTLSQGINCYAHQDRFAVSGGKLYGSSSTNKGVVATNNIAPSTGNLAGALAGTVVPALVNGLNSVSCYTLWFMTDAPKVQLNIVALSGYPVRIIVNGQYLVRAGHDMSTNTYMHIDFGSRMPRMIGIDINSIASIYGVKVDGLSRVWKPSMQDSTRVALTGDSHLQGAVAGLPTLAAHLVGKHCGIFDCRDLAVGGTGYIADNSGTRSAIRTQMDYWIQDGVYDLIGFAAGFNDVVTNSFPAATVADEALLCWKKARQYQPNALIVIFGVWATNSGPSAAVTALETALAARFATWADNFSVFIPVSNAPQPWEYGTGNTSATNASGNSDLYTNGSDLPHYNMLGQVYRGGRMVEALRGAVLSLSA